MSAPATTEKKYLKWYQKLAYGSGDLASNCSYGLVSSFVLLYPDERGREPPDDGQKLFHAEFPFLQI